MSGIGVGGGMRRLMLLPCVLDVLQGLLTDCGLDEMKKEGHGLLWRL